MTNADELPTLMLTRRFAACRERVWQAWTDPATWVQWLGPHDWPAVRVEADLRTGGRWHAVLRASSGEELEQGGVYLEIAPPERLRFTFRWVSDNHEDGPGVETEVTVKLEADGPATHMTFIQKGLANTASARGHEGGWQQTFDRLEALLEQESSAP